jgi:hypothetical protein
MIRPDDFFVQTVAAPDVAAHARGQDYVRPPATSPTTGDVGLDAKLAQLRQKRLQIQQERAKIQQGLMPRQQE